MIRAPKICGGSHIRAGLSGYVAEQVSARICYELGLPADLHESHASYVSHWMKLCSPRHNSSNREVSIM
jgi:antirestriction protein ArdC